MSKGIYARNGWWWCKFQVKGRSYREPLQIAVRGQKEERAAIERAAARKQQVINAEVYGEAEPVTWGAAVVEWHSAAVANKLRQSTITRYLISLGQLAPMLEPLDVQAINETTVRNIIKDRRKAGASNATIRRDLTALSQVLAHARREGWRKDNPALDYDRKAVPERRDPIALPRDADIAAMIAAAPGRFGDLIAFARATGMRQDEIAGLEWDRIDRRRMVAMLYRAKSRRVRAVPLTPAALALIDKQPRYLGGAFVFWHGAGERFQNPSSNFQRIRRGLAQKLAQRGATFQPFRFHDLRHLFAVEYLRDGRGSIYQLQQVLGHSSIQVTELYLDYLAPDERERAVAGK